MKNLQQKELDDIILACTDNKLTAQEKLYKHYFPLMYTICGKYSKDRQTIISLVNEGFLKIFLNLKNFDPQKGHFESWAKKIMTHTAIDFARGKNNRLQMVHGGDAYLEAAARPQYPDGHTEEEVLYQMKQLPVVTQKVFRMHIMGGYSHREIAQILEITESTCRWHVAEARKRLRQMACKIL